MYTFGPIPVCWFPAEWNLAKRKQREKFVLVVKNIPTEVFDTTLWNKNEFLV
jgi:hypothetical protein